ncbi:hypothetical protein ACF073_03590 [Streptomyces sp. NPDC015171]|uniref:hypothetical protein n=1 Tax=Streptomyces sp. NPDC015171 TaxID=3364945 RepID=UPI0037014545
MTQKFRTVLVGVAVLAQCLLTSCVRSDDKAVPPKICGTDVAPELTRPLMTSTKDLREFSRVDRSSGVSAPCMLQSGSDAVLGLRFSWDEDATDLMYLATDTGTVSRVTDPRPASFPYKTVIGNDGGISQAPCKTKHGNYFTLTLQLPQIDLTDQSHRKDIEKFMRVYFPATVKTLSCAR